jgi:hypothetical protein
MSGTLKSDWIKLQSNAATDTNSYIKNLFASVVRYFDNHPGYARIASNYGVGGTGLGFTWQTGKPGDGAFAVWRAMSSSYTTTSSNPDSVPRYDIVFVLGVTNIAITSSWEPAGNVGVWYTIAFHSSSLAAWNGTTNNNGLDNWTTRPWKTTSLVLCRSNGSGGNGSTTFKGLTLLDTNPGTDSHGEILITGDYDTTAIAIRKENSGVPWSKVCIFGGYQRVTASTDVPLVNLKFPPFAETYHTEAGFQSYGVLTYSANDVGIVASSSIGVKKLAIDYPGGFISDNSGEGGGNYGYQYYGHHTSGSSDIMSNYIIEWPITLLGLEWNGVTYYTSSPPNYYFVGGYLPNIRITSTNGGITRLYNSGSRIAVWFSETAQRGFVLTLPWNSSSTSFRNH